MTAAKQCFTIMPFSVREGDLARYAGDQQHWTEVYRGLIIPAVRSAGLDPQRDDEDVSSRLVAEGIWRKIESADLVLCDLSALNPNVYLELGWALRADKKIVLIKDDLTDFSFDINQFHTYKYSHRLQPSGLARAVPELAEAIRTTLGANTVGYSLVARAALQQRVDNALSGKEGTERIVAELLAEVRAIASAASTGTTAKVRSEIRGREIASTDDLIKFLVGTTWRKKNELEQVIFDSNGKCFSNHAGHPFWRENEYWIHDDPSAVTIRWSVDTVQSICRFSHRYTRFVEEENPEGVWHLIAERPHTPPWGV